MKFDCIIANPPYKYGNSIISKSLNFLSDNGKAVVLMPLSQYKKNNLSSYVTSFEITDPRQFNDAFITENLAISTLINNPINKYSYNDLLLKSVDQRYIKFYQWNIDNNKGIIIKSYHGKSLKDFDVNLDFVEMTRYISYIKGYGYHNKNEKSSSYRWNILKDAATKDISHLGVIHFDTAAARDNYTKYAYNWTDNKYDCLESKVLCGMRTTETSSAYYWFIPQIDWNNIHINQKDLWDKGLYDEAVLAEMGLQWDSNKEVIL